MILNSRFKFWSSLTDIYYHFLIFLFFLSYKFFPEFVKPILNVFSFNSIMTFIFIMFFIGAIGIVIDFFIMNENKVLDHFIKSKTNDLDMIIFFIVLSVKIFFLICLIIVFCILNLKYLISISIIYSGLLISHMIYYISIYHSNHHYLEAYHQSYVQYYLYLAKEATQSMLDKFDEKQKEILKKSFDIKEKSSDSTSE